MNPIEPPEPVRHMGHFHAHVRLSGRRAGFTLIELLVVIAIIALLAGLVFKGGGAMIDRGNIQKTESVLNALEQAITAYRSEVNQERIANAASLFEGAPPDNPHVFSGGTATTSITGCLILMGRGEFRERGTPMADGDLLDPRSTSDGKLSVPSDAQHGDIRALVLAIRLRSPKGSAILDQIDNTFKVSGEVDELYYDPGDNSQQIPLDYYVDAWETPIEYYSTRLCGTEAASSLRDLASDAFVKANNGEPLLVSYGPDGRDQFSTDIFSSEGDSSLVADYWAAPLGFIDSPRNQDNVYASDIFKQRMAK